MKADISIDARLINAAGIGTFLKAVVDEVASRRHLNLILLYWAKDRETVASYRAQRLIQVKSPIYSLKEQLEIPLKIPPCSLFYSPHINIPLLPIRAQKRLTTIHDTYHLAHAKQIPFFERLYASLFYNAIQLYSDRITTVSQFSYDSIHRYCRFVSKSISIISSGVHTRFSPTDSCVLETHGIAKPYLLTVGSLKPHKNIKRLIQAYAKLNLQEPLILVGSNKMRTIDTELFEVIKKLNLENKIRWLGYVKDGDLPSLYSSASLFIFPSLYEGFGHPPLEAMACGCPVLASRNASIPEVCADAAEYFNPIDSQELADKILFLLQHEAKREELRKKGFARAQHFPLQRSASSLVDLMEKLIHE